MKKELSAKVDSPPQETMSDDSDGTFVLLSSTRQVSPFLPVIPAKQILIREGDEIFYTYGAHSDDTLLAEYGFVLGVPLNSHNNVDVTQRVEALFHRLDTAEREEKVDLLREHQYWGCGYSPATICLRLLNPTLSADITIFS